MPEHGAELSVGCKRCRCQERDLEDVGQPDYTMIQNRDVAVRSLRNVLSVLQTQGTRSLIIAALVSTAVFLVARNANDASTLLLLQHPARLCELRAEDLARTRICPNVPHL